MTLDTRVTEACVAVAVFGAIGFQQGQDERIRRTPGGRALEGVARAPPSTGHAPDGVGNPSSTPEAVVDDAARS